MSLSSLTALLKQTDLDDHDEVLKAANAALKQYKNDVDAEHVKVVALLKLDRFNDAIHAFETSGDKLKQRAQLEYAYALYKTGKPGKAAQIAQSGSGRGCQHVEAQARYRGEDFSRAAELYQHLAANLEDDAEADLRINTGAVDAQLEWSGRGDLVRKKKPAREDLEAFETAYNAACGSIARDELGQGEVLLRRARDLCNAIDDLSEEEKQAELLPITVQQVYVLARQGRAEEVEKLAQSLDAKSIPDASTRLIAQVNCVATASTPANPYLAHRLVALDTDGLRPDHPFHFQSAILQRSRHAADLQTLKFSGTADSTAATISKQPSPKLDPYFNSLSVVNAAAHAKNKTGKEALKHIVPLLEKRPSDIGLILTIVQLYVLTGNSGSAITLLESFFARLEQSGDSTQLDVRFAPGLVGALTSLYRSSGRRTRAQTEFSKAATHWRRRPKAQAGTVHLLKAAGSALLESQDPAHQGLATEIFTILHQLDESDRYAAAGLLAASTSPSQISSSALTPIGRLISTIDAGALENAGIAQPPTAAATAITRKRPANEDTQKPQKAKKIRKTKLPKDYDQSKTPDLERWLPLRDRSTYRPKGKKGKARQALLSQGAAAPSEEGGSRPGTPAAEVVKGKGGTGVNAKKGKKTGGKR